MKRVCYDDFISPGMCAILIGLAKDRLQVAPGVDPKTGAQITGDFRTSETCFFQRGQNVYIEWLEARIASVIKKPVECGEGLQVIKYSQGGEYKPHYDFFTDGPAMAKHGEHGGQRVITCIIYLNTPEAGGATYFPEENLRCAAIEGRALIFNNLDENGEPDKSTLHQGEPVLKGEKYIATKWIRERPF